MRGNSVDGGIASVGTWVGLRAFEAEIQAGLAQDGVAIAKTPPVGRPAPRNPRVERKLKSLVSGLALVGLALVGWLAVPESRPAAAAAGISASSASPPALVEAGGGRAPTRPALRPALSD